MQYDAAISAASLNATLATSALSATTINAISSILNLDDSTTTLATSTSNGKNLSVNFDSNGNIVTPDVAYFSDLGADGTNVTVTIPTVLANTSAFIFDTAANVTATFGSATTTTSATTEGAAAGRVIVLGTGDDNITVNDSVNTHIDAAAGNDTITTAGGNDTIILNGGENIVKTGAGDDVIHAGSGMDKIDGGTGFDVVQLSGTGYTAAVSNGSVVFTGTNANGDATTATLTNVQLVETSAGNISVVASQDEATVMRFYEGLLGRDVDASGFQAWTAQLSGGATVTQIAQSFLNSTEYTAASGSQSDAAFIQSLYQGVLDRGADSEGLVFWAQQLATGHSRADVAVGIIGSTEAQTTDTGVIVITGQV